MLSAPDAYLGTSKNDPEIEKIHERAGILEVKDHLDGPSVASIVKRAVVVNACNPVTAIVFRDLTEKMIPAPAIRKPQIVEKGLLPPVYANAQKRIRKIA